MYKRNLIPFVLLIAVYVLSTNFFECNSNNNKVNVLVTIPLTGDAASYGQVQKNGIEIALAELKDDPVLEKLNIIYSDSKLSPKEALNILQQELVKNSISVTTPISTGEVLSMAPVCNEKKIVLLSPLASGDQITTAGDYVFRISPTDSYQGKELANAITRSGYKKTAILYVNDSWGKGLSDMFEKSYKDQNNEVTTIEICNPNQTDLRLQLSKIKESNPTALLLIVHPGEAVPALKQIKELGIKAQIFGGDTFSNKVIYSEALDVAQGVIFTLPATPNNEEYQKFSNEYKKRFNMDADINAAAAYDVLLLIAKAIKNGAYNGETIKEYFFNMKTEFIGATGLIKWDNNGDVVSKTYNSFIIKDNNYTIFK